mgnify:CR=1 FL=1
MQALVVGVGEFKHVTTEHKRRTAEWYAGAEELGKVECRQIWNVGGLEC